jgi:hypothetical protein
MSELHIARQKIHSILDRLIAVHELTDDHQLETAGSAVREFNEVIFDADQRSVFDDLPLARKLLLALTDAQFGGHGVAENLLATCWLIPNALFGEALALDFEMLQRRLPDRFGLLVDRLDLDDIARAFDVALERAEASERSRVRAAIEHIRSNSG